MLQGLQPTRKPIPGGMYWLHKRQQPSPELTVTAQSEIIAHQVHAERSLNMNLETSPSELTDTQQEHP
jgi:hypothetical protein